MDIQEAIDLLSDQPVWDKRKSYQDNQKCFSKEERDLIIELLENLWNEKQNYYKGQMDLYKYIDRMVNILHESGTQESGFRKLGSIVSEAYEYFKSINR